MLLLGSIKIKRRILYGYLYWINNSNFNYRNTYFLQRTSYQSIDEDKFKLYKIKKLGFLFKGMQGQSARTHGVILPMLIIQIQGYVVGIVTFCLFIFNKIYSFVNDSILMGIIILFIHDIITILITIITGFISKRR